MKPLNAHLLLVTAFIAAGLFIAYFPGLFLLGLLLSMLAFLIVMVYFMLYGVLTGKLDKDPY
jgi:hypothetical protein